MYRSIQRYTEYTELYTEVCRGMRTCMQKYTELCKDALTYTDLLRDSPDVGEALSEYNEHFCGATAEGRRGTVKGRVSGAKDDHSAPQLRECSLLARTHAYKKEYSV